MSEEQASELDSQIRNLTSALNKSVYMLGMLLARVKDKGGFEALGYQSFDQYLADTNLGVSRRTAMAYIQVYIQFVEKWGCDLEDIQDIPYYKLLMVTPKIKKNPETLEEWISKAESLSATDIKREIEDEVLEGEMVQDRPPKPEVYFCKDCGKWRIIADESELCKCLGNR